VEPDPAVIAAPEPVMSPTEQAALDVLIKRLDEMLFDRQYRDRQAGRFTVYKVVGASTDTFVIVCDHKDLPPKVERYVCRTGRRTKALYMHVVPRNWAYSNNPDTSVEGMKRVLGADIVALSTRLAVGNAYFSG
jgi:hypothetical protein